MESLEEDLGEPSRVRGPGDPGATSGNGAPRVGAPQAASIDRLVGGDAVTDVEPPPPNIDRVVTKGVKLQVDICYSTFSSWSRDHAECIMHLRRV
ncbi:unnamed protein product [Gadus morhua 'NCC']